MYSEQKEGALTSTLRLKKSIQSSDEESLLDSVSWA